MHMYAQSSPLIHPDTHFREKLVHGQNIIYTSIHASNFAQHELARGFGEAFASFGGSSCGKAL